MAQRALILSAEAGSLHISSVCYAELARRFTRQEDLNLMLLRFDCQGRDVDRLIAFKAGQLFEAYRRQGGTKHRILADFLVAADTLIYAERLLMRDQRFFGTTFPSHRAVTPAEVWLLHRHDC